MLTTIKLNYNLLFKGYEVYDLCFNRLLSSKLDTFKLTVSQTTPKYTFNVSCVTSQFYRIFLKVMAWFQSSFPHPLSPSRKGRGDF